METDMIRDFTAYQDNTIQKMTQDSQIQDMKIHETSPNTRITVTEYPKTAMTQNIDITKGI